ncbi:dedicator of cytokinesis protein 3-like [Physella acuta]|uniref:dedicator of cytokinesis protein 3-like n=1 Tax=Physella acuta TaxID=109671 RepID=UPI0027DD717E|nr:dedicator of cytokinesis protein 3-like [Physella acuta]
MTNGVWKPARRKYGVAISNFRCTTVQQCLNLQIGDTVQILEEYWPDSNSVTWLRGCTFSNKAKKGIFPLSYVVTKEFSVENEGPFEDVTPKDDAIIKELTFVLREWNGRWKALFVDRNALFQTIHMVLGELLKVRALLVSNTQTREQTLGLKHSAITMIDWGNGKLGMDLVPRVEYQEADPDKVSVVEMYRIHERSVKNCQGAWPGGMMKVKAREKQGETVHHLLFGLCSLACDIGDNAEVYLSLYDGAEGKFISERFVIYYNKDRSREANDKNSSTIFTDLSTDDMHKDIYLVIHILRKGRLTTEGSFKKQATFHYRRPWGVSVLGLKELFQINPENELEYFIRVYCVENDFANMHEILIKKQTQSIGKAAMDKQNQGVTLSVKILHGDLKNVKIENPLLFTRGIVLTQRMGFPEIINPGELRNDLYLTLSGAEFDRGSKTASKNIEARITVYNQNYEIIKGCILSANGDQMSDSFFSYVLYHSNAPKWNETIRLSIPIEKFNTAHIRIELCHCSNRDKAEKKLYGFAYLSVTTNENVTRLDGKYEMCIYKCEDTSKIKKYLELPSLKDDFADPKNGYKTIPYPHSNKEFIVVETFLCSSKFAQKAELLHVLQWRSDPSRIPENLEKLVRLKGQELVRYLQDVLDSLFDMFNAGDGESVPFAMNIFHTLVHIFNLLHKDVFEKFSVVLEDYLEKSFSSPLAHRDIMRCLSIQAERVYTCTDFDDKPTRKIFTVLGDIFKFSVKSCMLSQRMYGDHSLNEFKDNVTKVFKAFGEVLKSTEKELHKVQALMLNNLHQCYIPLLHIISVEDLAKLLSYLLSKINKDPGGSVIKAKMNILQNTINSQLLVDPVSRSMLLPICLTHIRHCLNNKINLELTANTLGDLLSTVYNMRESFDLKEEVTKIIQVVFDVNVRTLHKLESEKKIVSGNLLIACLIEMLRLMDVSHYQKLMGVYPKPKDLRVRLSTIAIPQKSSKLAKGFLNRVLQVFYDLVTTENFPVDWITMKMITSNVMLTSIQYIAEDLTVNFLNGDDFDFELWKNFFLLAVDFISQPALQLEKYSEAKSRQIKDKYNDMRVPVGFHIYSLWNQLGPHKKMLMMDMIGPFLKVTMVPQLELRKATIPIFFDIMLCEFKESSHLRNVEAKMIKELDSLVIEHNGDVEYKNLFSSILLDKVQSEPELQEEGKRFVFSVTDLLERLLDYRDIMDGEEQRDTKMHCTFNILNFYKDSRRDMYIRYISRLSELHYTANNFVEAGLTLRLYAQLLSWSDHKLPAEMSYPSETEAERKEELVKRIMDCFDKGKAWEYGIPLCKELADHYEKTFQYKKLGETLQLQASFFSKILEGMNLRQDPSYYRVAYYGNTFPPYLKNKAFIYRGDECLRLATIMSQLTREYPNASILTTNSPIDESCKQGDNQYIQLVNVKPVPSERPEFQGKEVPVEISSFYNTNEVDTFQFDRPYHRDDKDKNNEFKSLCLERTIMKSSYKLPGILRWYEVTSTTVVHFCPVQTAQLTVQQMNAELKSSIDNALKNPDQFLSHLTMRLQGVISGAVNGGIPKYQEAFFKEDYLAKYPNEATYVEELKRHIGEQLELLERGLSIYGKYASPEMLPLYKSLVDMFIKMKNSMGYQGSMSKQRNSNISSTSSTQRPSTPSSTSLNSSGSNRSSIISNSSCNDDDLYVEPPSEEYVHLPPPLCPDKRRTSSLRVAGLTSSPPKFVPPRPLSAVLTSNHHQPTLPSTVSQSSNSLLDPPCPPPLTPRKMSTSDQNGLTMRHKQDPPPIPEKPSRISGISEPDKVSSPSTSTPLSPVASHSSVPPIPPRTQAPTTPTTSRSTLLSPAAPPIPNKRQTISPGAPSSATGSYNNFSRNGPLSTSVSNLSTDQHHHPPIAEHAGSRSTHIMSAMDPPPQLISPKPPPQFITTKAPPPAITTPSPSRQVPPPPIPIIAEEAHSSLPNGPPPPLPSRKPPSTTHNTQL